MKLEDFRQLIAGFMKHLNERNTQYKIAKRYGLVIEEEKAVIFYFERYEKETKSQPADLAALEATSVLPGNG